VSCVVALPERCGNGHEWGPGLVLVSWQQCHCAGAQMLHPDRAIWGHFTVACREPGVPVGVVRPAARARPGGVKGPGTSPTLPSQRSPGGQVGRRAHGAPG